jgi:D-3-phosphoglycerate dehydrogenase / 2-oxoglutarate reductase
MKIVIAESTDFSAAAAEELRRIGEVAALPGDRAALMAALPDADVLWVRLRHRVDSEVLRVAPRLKYIVTNTTGLNHIDLEESKRLGIEVLSLRGETTFLDDVRATAELTVGLLLGLMRAVPAAASHVRAGGWDRDSFKGRELYGKTIGVVGYGRLGRIVARYVRAFDMRVLTTDPNVAASAVGPEVTMVDLPELLRGSDVVTLHVALSPATVSLLGGAELDQMRRGSFLVNTSRGELLDEPALLRALESGHLAGAALDVLCGEQDLDLAIHPLVRYAQAHTNLLITPHIGGCTWESLAKTEEFLARRLVDRVTSLNVAS